MKCSPASVSRWQSQVRIRGPDALRAKPAPGRPRLLSAEQRKRLLQLLLKGAMAHGYSTDLWTLPRVAEVIERTFGVRYHPAHVWKIRRGEGWSCQKPERRARERDEEAIETWRQERWPHIKNAKRAGRSLVLVDESGFMLQPVVRRTWAPRGQTPILRQWDRRDRLSTLGALTVAPRRKRYGLYWATYTHNIGGEEVVRFLQNLRRHLPHGFTLIWDRAGPHRAARVKAWLARRRRIVVEGLPPYCLELNPVEAVWSHTKHGDLANFAADSLEDLQRALLSSMSSTRTQRRLLLAFFKAAGLEVFTRSLSKNSLLDEL